jgi:hypothetical protein
MINNFRHYDSVYVNNKQASKQTESETTTDMSFRFDQLSNDAKSLVAANCLRFVKDGATFREWKKDKKKEDSFLHVVLSPDERELQWTVAHSATSGPNPHASM